MEGVSRRSFLKTAGTVSLPLFFGLAAGGASGYSTAIAAEASPDDTVQVSVHETDVLVIGGGLAGCSAARSALDAGASVTILDKGPWGHSGTSGINWGHDMMTAENIGGAAWMNSTLLFMNGMSDQALWVAAGDMQAKYRQNYSAEQLGMITDRLAVQNTKSIFLRHGYFNRYLCQFVKRMGATIYDRTMAVDLAIDGQGRVGGAVAIDMRDGSAHLFRAKATVLATGSYAWIGGWNGMGAHSIAAPENTGDGHAMLIKRGVPMRDMEQSPCDFVQWTPMATREGMGAMGASTVNATSCYDGEGNPIINEEYQAAMAASAFQNAEFMRACLAVIHDGKGGPNGGIMCDITSLDQQDRYYRHFPEVMDALGYEYPDRVELCPEIWESAGRPWNIEAATSAITDVPGLFHAAAAAGAWQGSCYFAASGTGLLAGEGAADLAFRTDAAPAVDWDGIGSALSETYGLLEANPEDGIRSAEVFRNIQEVFWDKVNPIRCEEGLLEGIAEFERIENEVLPKMYVPSKSKTLNFDWMRAIEAKNLLLCGMGTAQAALVRKESRGAHCRIDYPEMDNENCLANTKTQRVDGVWGSELGALVDSYVPTADVRASLVAANMIGFPIER